MILFVNACVRRDSRTKELALHLLSKLSGIVQEVALQDLSFPKADASFLQKRDALLLKREYGDELFAAARGFAAADEIVIAAPYWDLSFPAALKQYFEQINAIGITFDYGDDGAPVGLCRAKKLYYVTTAGGPIFSEEYGYGYVKALAKGFYGIPETVLFKAEGLDIWGADARALLREAKARIDKYFAAK